MKITKDEFSSLVLSKDKIKKINNILLGEYKKIGRAHVRTPVTSQSRMPSSA